MTPDETPLEVETAGTRVPARGKIIVPRVTRRAGRSRSRAVDAFLAAHRALSGAPAGGIDARVTLSADPARWRYHAELKTSDHFAGTDLKKSVLKLSACIGWDWASAFSDNPWEAAVAAAHLVHLGAKPIAPPEPAEAAWEIRALTKESTAPYALKPFPVIALQLGPVCIISPLPHWSLAKARQIAAEKLSNAVRLHVTARLLGDPA